MRLTAVLLRNIVHKVGDVSKQFANLPESYVKRSTQEIYWKTPKAPQYLNRTVQRKQYRFTTNRPWTYQARAQNRRGEYRKKVFVEPIKDWSFFRGDRVEILAGRDKGKQGIVSSVIQERNWVIVEGLNTHLRRMGKDKDFPGTIVASEAPLLVTTDVKLVDPSDMEPCTVEWRYTEKGERVRVSQRTGRLIPIPVQNSQTYDYKSAKAYKPLSKDTNEKEVKKITFKPELKTFEMDLMEKLNIDEDRVRKTSYWY